jgi:iron-sulfur cluster assembly accessory protein
MTTTDAAIKKIEELKPEDKQLRIRIQGGGCSGFRYDMVWDEPSDEDIVIGPLIIDKISHMYIMDSEIDFVDGLVASGFKINNPNATGTCGCGESFAV